MASDTCKEVFLGFVKLQLQVFLAYNEISDIDNAFDGMFSIGLNLFLGGNWIEHLPVGAIAGHS